MGKRHIFHSGEYHTSYGEAKRKCLHLKSNLVDPRNKDDWDTVSTNVDSNSDLNCMKYIFQIIEWSKTNCVPEFWIENIDGKKCGYMGPDGTSDNCGKQLPVICIKTQDLSICPPVDSGYSYG